MSSNVTVKLAVSGAQAVTNAFKGLQSQLAGLSSSLGGLGGIATLGGLLSLAKSSINSADEMGRLAQQTGVAVGQISALSYAAKLADVSQDDLLLASKSLSEQLVKQGRVGADFESELLRLSDIFQKMPDGPRKVALAIDTFGRSGQRMIPLLNQGSAALRDQMDEARAFGVAIGPEFAARADEFNDNIDRLKAAAQGGLNKILEPLLPNLIKKTQEWVDAIKDGEVAWKALEHVVVNGNLLLAWTGQADTAAKVFAKLKDEVTFLYNFIRGNPLPQVINLERTAPGKKPPPRTADQETPGGKSFNERLKEFQDFTQKELALVKAAEEAKRLAIEAEEAKKKSIIEDRWAHGLQALRDGQAAALAFGKEGFIAYKALAIAEATISAVRGAQGAFTSLVETPYIGVALGTAAAAASLAAGYARIHQIVSTQPAGYQAGGYTGDGFVGSVAGQVHKREFVFDAPAVDRIGVPALEAMRKGEQVTPLEERPMSVALFDDREKMREWIRKEGRRQGRVFVLQV